MTLTEEFIARLEALKPGERARLRQLAGSPLDDSLQGFDLFTGLWWPLRQRSPRAPERRSAWLVAKLYGASPLPHVRDSRASLPRVLGRAEPGKEEDRDRFRRRMDALLLAPLARLEPHLAWALGVARKAVGQGRERGIDWARLLEDLRLWDRANEGPEDIRSAWADQYFSPQAGKGDDDAD